MLIYRIDASDPKLLRLFLSEKGALHKRILYASTLKEIARQADQEPLALLMKAKARQCAGASIETLSFQQIDLDPKEAHRILGLLCKTGRLFFGKVEVQEILEGKLYWQAQEEGSFCKAECSLMVSRKIAFSECQGMLFLSDFFALVGSSLVRAPCPSMKWLEAAVKGPLLLEGAARRRFFEDVEGVLWKKKEELPLEAEPQLELSDATGCFANLFVNYPGVGRVALQDPAPFIGTRKRLLDVEKNLAKDLREAGYQLKQVGKSSWYCPGDLVDEAISLLLSVGWQLFDVRGRSIKPFQSWECALEECEEGLRVSFGEEQKKALEALKENRRWVDLEDRVAWIDRKKGMSLFAGLLDLEGSVLPKMRLGALLPLLDLPEANWSKQLRAAAEQMRSCIALERQELGPSFCGTLLPYQQMGVDWLFFLHRFGFGGFLADEMGLGKTVQMLAFFSLLRTNLPVLIVCPTSLLYNWASEFRRFLPDQSVEIYAGGGRQLKGAKFIVTSYAILRQDIEELCSMDFEVAIFDESNVIKNAGAQISQAALRLKAKSRFCLSGTPIENRSSELISQFAFLMPRLLSASDRPELLQQKIRPFFLRRRKSEVAIELPEKIDAISWIEMTEAQRACYEEHRQGALKRLDPLISQDGASAHRMEILEALLRLRQICLDPRLVGVDTEGAKLEQFLSDWEELRQNGCKVLVYSQFTSMLDLVQKSCGPALRIDGSTMAKERAEQVRRFQEEEESLLFLLSLKAGGVGLNLTAADVVILLDPWWNEAVESQAIDRAHRIGRKETVFVKRYLTPQSIEEKMLQLKLSKQKIAASILEGSESALSTGDLFDLLNNQFLQ